MLSKRLQNLNPYIPGEQPEGAFIKINANENPYPPPIEIIEGLSQYIGKRAMDLALYPDPDSCELRKSIACMLNESGGLLNAQSKLTPRITDDMIFCGNGSDEVLSFLFYAFFDSDKELIVPEYTYSFYPVYAAYYDIPLKKIPLHTDWTLDTDSMLATKDSATGIIFANPNAPTGIVLIIEQIEAMLEQFPKNRVMVVDEAYVDFGTQTVLPLLQKYKNLVVVRTFSKSFSFAGMRLGFCVAHPELIAAVTKVKNSFNHFPVDALTQKAGSLACTHWRKYSQTAKVIARDRDIFSASLKKSGWEVLPSSTNFVMVKKISVGSGLDIYECLKEKQFLVRYFDNPATRDYVRITIGTTEQMERLAKIMANMGI